MGYGHGESSLGTTKQTKTANDNKQKKDHSSTIPASCLEIGLLFLPSAPCFDHDQSEINQVLPPEKGWQEVSLSLEGGFCVSDSHALIRHCPSTVKLALTLENVTNSGRYSGWAGLETGKKLIKLIDLASLGIVWTAVAVCVCVSVCVCVIFCNIGI